MESSIKVEKTQSMRKHKRNNQFIYNLVLYSLTSLITFLFFSYPFWIPSMRDFFLSFPNDISSLFNAKCFFILGNVIVFILISESKLTRPRSSPASEIYEEYMARSRRSRYVNSTNNILAIGKEEEGFMQKINIEGNLHREEKKEKRSRVYKSVRQPQEKKMGLRESKSEVWGESGILKRVENREKLHHGEKKEKEKETKVSKRMLQNDQEKKMGLRASKSELWGESAIVEREENKENLNHEEKKEKEMTVSKSMPRQDEEKKRGLRASKSEVWGESAIVKRERANEKKEDMPTEELNTRVEAFIARINKQRLVEAKLLHDGRG